VNDCINSVYNCQVFESVFVVMNFGAYYRA